MNDSQVENKRGNQSVAGGWWKVPFTSVQSRCWWCSDHLSEARNLPPGHPPQSQGLVADSKLYSEAQHEPGFYMDFLGPYLGLACWTKMWGGDAWSPTSLFSFSFTKAGEVSAAFAVAWAELSLSQASGRSRRVTWFNVKASGQCFYEPSIGL